MNRDEMRKKVVEVLVGYGATKIAIFGSYARGEAAPDSDLDILVDFAETKSLFDMVGIEMELADKLGIKVDLLTEAAISPYLIDRIHREAEVVYT